MSGQRFIAADGHRWWLDPKDCSHANADACKSCDFDRYYANTYDSVPWRETDADEL
jgi:hypothetical protein